MVLPTAPMVHRFNREEYHNMAKAGLFADGRVDLLEGEVLTMSLKLTLHTSTVNRLMYALITKLGSVALVWVQDPIVLNDWSEPDLAVCQPDLEGYAQAHPRADQVLLVIEVADTSLTYDRTRKAEAYATSGIPEYWLVNLNDRWVEMLTNPDSGARRYGQERLAYEGGTLFLPGGQRLAVADFMPRP